MKIFVNNKMYIQKRDLGILWKKGVNVSFDKINYNIAYFASKIDSEFLLVEDPHLINIIKDNDWLVDYLLLRKYSLKDLELLRRQLEYKIVELSKRSMKERNNELLVDEIYLLMNKVEAIGSIVLEKENVEDIILPNELQSYFNNDNILQRLFKRRK